MEEKELRKIIYLLLDHIDVIAVDMTVIKKSLLSEHKDFEDAVQIFVANSVHDLDCIVTRNVKDFKKTNIPVFSPDEFLLYLK